MVAAQCPVTSQIPLAQPRYVLHTPFVQSYGAEPQGAPIGKLVTHVFVLDSHSWLAHCVDAVHPAPLGTHGAQVLVVESQ